MKTTRTHHRRPGWLTPGVTLILLLPTAPTAWAEDVLNWDRDPVIPQDLDAPAAFGAANAANRANRIRLFGMTPAFLADPVGLSDTDEPADGQDAADPGPEWLQVAMGNDNPFFDLRHPGDPGGVGYYKVHTQVQLVDSPNTGCAVAVQAATPAGREYDGLEDGPTVVSPSFSLFHALDDGTAIQGFVGKHVNLNSNWPGQLNQSVHYGLAVQRPILAPGADGSGNVFVFVEALGRYRYEASAGNASANTLEMLPGLHWQMAPNWWMSGGVVLPVSTPTTSVNQWQFTCSFQF